MQGAMTAAPFSPARHICRNSKDRRCVIHHSGGELPWLRWFRGGFRLAMVGDAVVQLGAHAAVVLLCALQVRSGGLRNVGGSR